MDEQIAWLKKIHEEQEKTNGLIKLYSLPIFALLVILVALEIVHR